MKMEVPSNIYMRLDEWTDAQNGGCIIAFHLWKENDQVYISSEAKYYGDLTSKEVINGINHNFDITMKGPIDDQAKKRD